MKIVALLVAFSISFSPMLNSVKFDSGNRDISDGKTKATQPSITKVYTSPIPIRDNWVRLPRTPGMLTIHVEATNTSKVRYWLYPTGTAPKKYKFLGEDNDPSDGWSYRLKYGDKIYHDHIVIEALGPGGSNFVLINITSQVPESLTYIKKGSRSNVVVGHTRQYRGLLAEKFIYSTKYGL